MRFNPETLDRKCISCQYYKHDDHYWKFGKCTTFKNKIRRRKRAFDDRICKAWIKKLK